MICFLDRDHFRHISYINPHNRGKAMDTAAVVEADQHLPCNAKKEDAAAYGYT
jgi:hypothetical protein